MFAPRRRPLMRAAMMGGAGYVAGKRAQRGAYRESDQEARIETLEQQQGGGAQAAAPAQAAPAPGGEDVVARLRELKGLLDAGALSQEEFDAAKRKVLGA
jgi:membrane protease subunit (stomatin/prohibitin family)